MAALRAELDRGSTRRQLQHDTGPQGGHPCTRCGLRFSPKMAYVACFEEGDTLVTWMERQSDEVLGMMPEDVTESVRRQRAQKSEAEAES